MGWRIDTRKRQIPDIEARYGSFHIDFVIYHSPVQLQSFLARVVGHSNKERGVLDVRGRCKEDVMFG
jgi:hypothetical protein